MLELENEVSVNVTYGLGEKKALQIINYGATAVFIHGYQYGASPPVFIDSPTIALREQVISFSPLGFEEAAKNGGITGSKAEIRWTPCMLFIKNRLGEL